MNPLNPLRLAEEITISTIKLRLNLWEGTVLKVIDDVYLMEQELNILSGTLTNIDDKNKVDLFASGASCIIGQSKHLNFRKIADGYLLDLQSCLIALQIVLCKRGADAAHDLCEPNPFALNA